MPRQQRTSDSAAGCTRSPGMLANFRQRVNWSFHGPRCSRARDSSGMACRPVVSSGTLSAPGRPWTTPRCPCLRSTSAPPLRADDSGGREQPLLRIRADSGLRTTCVAFWPQIRLPPRGIGFPPASITSLWPTYAVSALAIDRDLPSITLMEIARLVCGRCSPHGPASEQLRLRSRQGWLRETAPALYGDGLYGDGRSGRPPGGPDQVGGQAERNSVSRGTTSPWGQSRNSVILPMITCGRRGTMTKFRHSVFRDSVFRNCCGWLPPVSSRPAPEN